MHLCNSLKTYSKEKEKQEGKKKIKNKKVIEGKIRKRKKKSFIFSLKASRKKNHYFFQRVSTFRGKKTTWFYGKKKFVLTIFGKGKCFFFGYLRDK